MLLQDTTCQPVNVFVFIIAHYAEVALHGLDWAGEVEIEAKFHNDVKLKLDQSILADILLFFI